MTENKCDCKNCECMKIIERLQFNLKKDCYSVREALNAAIDNKLYIP